MSDLPDRIDIIEEGPREGFQIEPGPIPTARKIELIDALSQTGEKHIQTVSFVNPKRVPGMADAGEVVVHTLTFGNPVFASRSTILSITEDGRALIDNHTLAVEQQIRFAGEDAHVLEKPSRAGGVTFVRCPDAPERAFAPMQSKTPGATPPAPPTSPPAGDG